MHKIIPFSKLPAVPHQRAAVVQHHLDRQRTVAVRRDLRRGGELDGVRVIKPETLRAAVKECRRLRPDVATGLVPLRWGTGYMLGSNRFGPFGRDAPAAFGHTGLINIAVWADPERGLAAGLISSGKPGGPSRGQALSGADGPHRRRDTPRAAIRIMRAQSRALRSIDATETTTQAAANSCQPMIE